MACSCNDLQVGNRGGIPIVDATQSNAGSATTNAVYSLPSHVFASRSNRNAVLVNFLSATAATVTGVTISVNGSTRPLTNGDGTPVPTLTAGWHWIVVDKANNTINLVV